MDNSLVYYIEIKWSGKQYGVYYIDAAHGVLTHTIVSSMRDRYVETLRVTYPNLTRVKDFTRITMPPVIVVCPTYKKFDLCVKMIESANMGSVVPDAYIILDNGAGGFNTYCQSEGITFGDDVAVIVPEENMGVARAWNFLLNMVEDNVPDALCIVVNDDMLFYEDTIEKLVKAALDDFMNNDTYALCYCPGGVDAPNAFSLFMVHPTTYKSTLGLFDETLWPGYFDDNDAHWRMKLQGLDLTRVPDCSADHGEGSATLKAYTPEETKTHHHQFRRNQEYYLRKWGGEPGSETFTQPFNNTDIMAHMVEIHKRYGF